MTDYVVSGTPRLLIMGHRGAREVVPENTLAAYGFAIASGVDAIELDVQLTADGELAVMHDARLERTTNGHGPLRELTLAQLKELNAAANHAGPDYGVQRIPTLQEVYDFVQGRVQINVEIKMDAAGARYAGIEEKVMELTLRNQAAGYTVVSSFSFPTVAAIRAMAPPDLRIYAIVGRDYFADKGPHAPATLVSELGNLGVSWVAVQKDFLSPERVAALKAEGAAVHAWVVNDVAEMWELVGLGVDAITTDRPDIIVPAYRAGKP